MHDLMHDLARSIMGNECLSHVNPVMSEDLLSKTRHIYQLKCSPSNIYKILNNSPKIRTLLSLRLLNGNIAGGNLSKPILLRSLDMHDNDIIQLPIAIRYLKHLRYLDLSGTNIKALPEGISTLFNLQTLKLSNCCDLYKLPDGMRNMSRLRHLYIDRCNSLKHLPAGMGQLRSLRTLTNYIVGNDTGRSIGELNGLNLGGSLVLHNLKNVRDAADAKEANLSSKHNLSSLILCWDVVKWDNINYGHEDTAPEENAEEVLEALVPHNRLKQLAVRRYSGRSFPTWMTDSLLLQNLVKIHLIFCTGCEYLPPLWRLRSLEFLYLIKMDKVKHICSSTVYRVEGNVTEEAFPSLKGLVLNGMQSLKTWLDDEETANIMRVFPLLTHLKIINCPNLITMPGLPSLERLEMEGTSMQLGLANSLTPPCSLRTSIHLRSTETESPPLSQKKMLFSYFKSLERLDITAFEDLALLLEEEKMKWLSTSLHYLKITGCNRLFSPPQQSPPLGFWMNLTSLLYLDMYDCDDLVTWPEEFHGLNSLKQLHIYRCNNFSPLPSSSSSSRDEKFLRKLEVLHIKYCDGLLELPKLPTSLRSLEVVSCPKLKSLTEGLRHTTALDKVDISHCKSLTSLPVDLGHLTALTSMRIHELPGLESLPQGLGQLVALQSLEIIGCGKFSCLPEGMQGFTSLQRLHIQHCPRLSSLPKGLQQRLPSLQALVIEGCPNLERYCRRGGLYWLS